MAILLSSATTFISPLVGNVILLSVSGLLLMTIPLGGSNLWFGLTFGGGSQVWPLLLMVGLIQLLVYNSSFNFTNGGGAPIFILSLLVLAYLLSNSLIIFYLTFEASLIPMVFMIMSKGYQPERLSAVYSMVFYTLAASLPLLVVIVYTSLLASSFYEISEIALMTIFNPMLFLGALMGVFVKMPLYSLHLWLPKAHVEASVEGSMILAAILLKLGGWGIIQLSPLASHASLSLSLMSFSILGGGLITMVCLRQTDMKMVIAYSSVSHMSMVIFLSLISKCWSIFVSVIIMVAHSFSSSWMFFVSGIIYSRTHTRNVLLAGSSGPKIFFMVMVWFLPCLVNLGGPPSMSFWGEILGLIFMMSATLSSWPILGFMLFLSAAYNLVLFINVYQGNSPNHTPQPLKKEELIFTFSFGYLALGGTALMSIM